jgi:peroxiredoxin Q/BCP
MKETRRQAASNPPTIDTRAPGTKPRNARLALKPGRADANDNPCPPPRFEGKVEPSIEIRALARRKRKGIPMSLLNPGEPAPDFTLPDETGKPVSLKDFRGRKVVLYFYPKDDTPGCTQESCDFRDSLAAASASGAAILGLSRDDAASHRAFKDKYALSFPLLSDLDGKVCEDYGVWVEKNMYGRKYMGIDRTTVLIDERGAVLRVWRKVKVGGHVAEVLDALKAA